MNFTPKSKLVKGARKLVGNERGRVPGKGGALLLRAVAMGTVNGFLLREPKERQRGELY